MLLFDASALVSLFIPSNATARIKEYVRLNEPVIGLSDVAAGEFASAVAMRVRTLNLSAEQGQKVLTVCVGSISSSACQTHFISQPHNVSQFR
jgi:predicted nucleic acid-binding protein